MTGNYQEGSLDPILSDRPGPSNETSGARPTMSDVLPIDDSIPGISVLCDFDFEHSEWFPR